MICSANEVMTLAAKAARGAGAPSAQASRFGEAALCHFVANRDPQPLKQALDDLPMGAILDLPVYLMSCAEAATNGVFEGISLRHKDAALFDSYLDALPYGSDSRLIEGGGVRFRLFFNQPQRPVPPARVDLPDPLARHLQSLAARILVPESDASRRSGAGAGLTDND